MSDISYQQRRGEIEHYFDRTAVDAWKKLTSDAPVGKIRATVRAGRDEMRSTLLGWLPQNLEGARILDAGFSHATVRRQNSPINWARLSSELATCSIPP